VVIVEFLGPPGTGKTYVGLKIVETLLYNLYEVPHGEKLEGSKYQLTHSSISYSSPMMMSYLYCSVTDCYQLCLMLLEKLVNTL